MDDKPPVQKKDALEIESLKKTTRIFLDDALSAKPIPKKATTSVTGQVDERKATGPIMGIPTHTAPIPQTIRLKRPSTSPIVISPPDITTAPTVVKVVHHKPPTSPVAETPTVIKKTIPPASLQETSRIILELGPQAADLRPKTGPLPSVSSTEPTPGPKTIRLKRPSTIMPVSPVEAKQAPSVPPAAEPGRTAAGAPKDIQTAKKSETAKIELPKDTEYQTSATQRKTIKIKRTDRNAISRTTTAARQTLAGLPGRTPALGTAEAKPQPAEAIQSRDEAKEELASKAPILEEPLPVFSILAGLAVVCLALLVYLLASQAFGPKLFLPVPSGLF